MTGEEVKETVREHYGKIAVEGSSCCASGCGCGDEVDLLSSPMNDTYQGYDKGILDAADLGLGCGAPTRFADLKEGMTVLDLGSGAGIDVFIAAKQIGPTGVALGLDMTEEGSGSPGRVRAWTGPPRPRPGASRPPRRSADGRTERRPSHRRPR